MCFAMNEIYVRQVRYCPIFVVFLLKPLLLPLGAFGVTVPNSCSYSFLPSFPHPFPISLTNEFRSALACASTCRYVPRWRPKRSRQRYLFRQARGRREGPINGWMAPIITKEGGGGCFCFYSFFCSIFFQS